jgi:hypothetical protein
LKFQKTKTKSHNFKPQLLTCYLLLAIFQKAPNPEQVPLNSIAAIFNYRLQQGVPFGRAFAPRFHAEKA